MSSETSPLQGMPARPALRPIDVGADDQRHGQQQQAGQNHQPVEQPAVDLRQPLHLVILAGAY